MKVSLLGSTRFSLIQIRRRSTRGVRRDELTASNASDISDVPLLELFPLNHYDGVFAIVGRFEVSLLFF